MIDKNSLDDYIEKHLSAFQQEEVNNSGNVEYKMALVSQERGLYSGIVSYFNSVGKKEYREFIVDFVNRELTIKGITGKELKATPANLNKVFNYGYYHNSCQTRKLGTLVPRGIVVLGNPLPFNCFSKTLKDTWYYFGKTWFSNMGYGVFYYMEDGEVQITLDWGANNEGE